MWSYEKRLEYPVNIKIRILPWQGLLSPSSVVPIVKDRIRILNFQTVGAILDAYLSDREDETRR